MVKVSIVIPNYNGTRFIRQLFESLALQSFKDFEIIFVDNHSSDNSLQILKEVSRLIPEIPLKVLKSDKNEGYCKANNKGVIASEGDLIVFLNNDTYVSETWLEELVNILDTYPYVGACGSKIIFAATGSLQTVGQLLDKYGWVESLVDHSLNSGCIVDTFFYAPFVSIMVRRKILSRYGSFDENLFLTGDYDLGWRIRLYGYSHAVALDSVCYHYGSYTVKKFHDVQKFYLQYKEKTYTLLKNFSLSKVVRRLPISISFMTLSAVYKSLKLRKSYLLVLIKAFFWNAKNFKRIWTERTRVQFDRLVNDSKIETYMYPYPFILTNRKLSSP